MQFRVTSVITWLFLLVVGASPAFSADKTVVPDWVRQAAAQPLPTYPPDTDAVVLLDEITYIIVSPTEYVEHRRRAVKILRPSGEYEGSFSVHFRGEERVLGLHSWSIDSTGHEFEVKDKEFFERAASSDSLYDDVRYRTAKVPAARVGSVVAFESDVRRHPFFDQLIWIPQETLPVRHTSITVQLPPGFEYKDLWFGMAAVPPKGVGPNRWQWAFTDLSPIKQETHMPNFVALAGRMKLTYFGLGAQPSTDSWHALGKWYIALTADRRSPTPELSSKVHELTDGKNEFFSKVRALTEFMQKEVRYVAIEIGVGGYQPHPAADVFRARYGDCKDKATLLSTMLREIGIASHYVIIDSKRGIVKPEMPSSMFDHVILAVELPLNASTDKMLSLISDKSGKRYLLFDPTNPYTPVGEIPSYLQDSYALLVTPSGGEIVHTPVLDPDLNRNVRKGTFRLTAEGTLEGKVESKMSGDPASVTRDVYRSLSDQERMQTAERNVTRSLRTASIKDLKLEALDRISDELVMRFDLTSDRYAQITGPLMLVRPRVLGQHAFGLEHKERLYPIELRSTAKDEDEFEIEIPPGYAVDDVPEPKKLDSSFASYQSEFKVSGSKITYKRTFVNRALEIPTDKIAEFRAFQNQIAEDENAVVVLKKSN